jgi:protein-glutamine gamma-glutamyltransferase
MISRERPVRAVHFLTIVTFLIAFLVFLSVATYLDPLVPAIFSGLYIGAVLCEWRHRFLPRILLTVSSAIILVVYVFRFQAFVLAPLTVETLLLLLGVKLLEKKQFRDYVQIYLISVFLLAGAALLGISLIFLCYVVVLVFFLNVAMILVTYFRSDPSIILSLRTMEKILLKGSLIPIAAIPLGIVIFIITPRTPYPLLDFLNQNSHGVTGFSDHVRLGKVSDIQQDDRPIFRAAMRQVPEGFLYWRGIVLEHFDGSTWKSLTRREAPERHPGATTPSVQVSQEIFLEPYGDVYLFGLDRPSAMMLRGAREYRDGTFAAAEPVGRKMRYRVSSYPQNQVSYDEKETASHLQLPPDLSPRITELAAQLKAADQETTLNTIFQFLNSKSFSYSLRHLPVAQKPLDDFLFSIKQGNCEYFASAFAVLARANRIPARLVAGYLGGLYSNMGKYYLVSQKLAHVWVEAYVKGKGWVRYDPTPSRIGVATDGTGFFSQAVLYFDMINYYWIAFVVNYDVQKQYSLFFRATNLAEETGNKLARIPPTPVAAGLVGLSLLIFLSIRVRRSISKSAAEKLVDAFSKKLETRGFVRNVSQGLEEFVRDIGDERIRCQAQGFATGFQEVYYRDRAFTKGDIRDLRRKIRQIDGKQRDDRRGHPPSGC